MTDRIIDAAIAWHSAQQRDDCDWDAFARWLEADTRHRDEYDAIALIDTAIDAHRPALQTILPADRAAVLRRRWPVWTAGALAAALTLTIGITQFAPGRDASVAYRTGPGESRTIALADGSQIHLAAASALTVSGARQDRLTLEGGAYFDIRHDPARAMVIRAGDQQVTDIGTRFDILTAGRAMRIAVSLGVVSVSSPALGQAVRLDQGRQLIVDPAHGQAEVESVQVADVGAWQQGRLAMDNMPLSLVAAEISRYARRRVTVASDIAGRRFSGVLVVGDGSALVGEVARLMDLRVVRDGSGVMLAAGRP
jgi:transmembrane sensor